METPRLVGKLYSNRKVVSVLAALFGISSWIEVNGLWVELPLLLSKLPDAAVLPSYIVILTQAANLGPILYSIARFYYKDKLPDKLLIHLTMMVGTTASLLLIWLWDKTSYVGGSLHSTAFLSLAFFLAIVDCTSSVLYLPFVGRLRHEHLMPFLIGEGLSGLLPALVALAQGVGGNPRCVPENETWIESNGSWSNFTAKTFPVYPSPRFSVEAFFGFLVVMLVVSWTAFTFLSIMPATIAETNEGEVGPASGSNSTTTEILSSSSSLMRDPRARQISNLELVSLLCLQAFICSLTNGFLPSLQSISCLPYGNVAYHLSVTLSSLSNPLACFVAVRWWSGRPGFLGSLTTIGLACASYLIATAALSPTPPLVDTRSGEALLIVSWVLFTGILSYARACLAAHLRLSGNVRSLFYLGACTQVGSFAGAVISFSLVNFTNIFVFYSPCS